MWASVQHFAENFFFIPKKLFIICAKITNPTLAMLSSSTLQTVCLQSSVCQNKKHQRKRERVNVKNKREKVTSMYQE